MLKTYKIIARVLILLILMIAMSGCQSSADENPFIQAQQALNNLESYSAIISYQIMDGEEIREYKFRQWVQMPDCFKVELFFPDNLEGKTIISDGKEIYMNHPKVKDSLKFEMKSVKQQRPLFIGDFLNIYWLSEEVEKEQYKENGEEYIILSCMASNEERLYKRKSLWLDRRKMLPVKMMDYDGEGNVASIILFEEFNARWKVPADFFNIP